MRIDLFNIREFIELNHLQEVTSAVLFQRGDVPHPNGLISNEIFGITTRSRKTTFAYIDLVDHYFHPHIYKVIKRLFRNIEKIVNGDAYYSIDKHGHLIPDNENGETGIGFLYENWDRIKWDSSEVPGMRNERIDLLNNYKKDEIFMQYQLVIPAFYRDIKTSKKGGGETDDINKLYCKLIRLTNLVRGKDMFDFQFNSTNYNIQETLVEIYDFFKVKLEKKNGILRKFLLGRNVDLCTRTVITAPIFHEDRPEDSMVDMHYSAVPISQCCSLVYPFMLKWIKDFFEREVFDSKTAKVLYDPITDEIVDTFEIINPEAVFTDKYIDRMIRTYYRDPESRFNKIEIPVKGNKKMYLSFTGMRSNAANKSEISKTAFRPMTWTDLLYMAACQVTKDKHVIVTRYPLLNEFGIFISRIHVSSTLKTEPMVINGELYPWYPIIDFSTPPEMIASSFIDSMQFSNSYLPGLDGDYDGDQTTAKILFTQEANAECEKVMHDKGYFINSNGANIRKIELEAIQTFYVMTKTPGKNSKPIGAIDKKYFIDLHDKEYTFSNMVSWFGNTVDTTDGNKTNAKKSRFNVDDTFTLLPEDGHIVKESTKTTLGRYVYNRVVLVSNDLIKVTGYINDEITDGKHGYIEQMITTALTEDRITIDQMYSYVNIRDWLGLELHAVITTSFTMGTLKIPPEVAALKKELLKKYEKEIASGDPKASEEIEKQLIAKTKEVLKDDVGMDLYNSGARGSIGNNYKNNLLYRGAIYNRETGKYDIVTNALNDGLEKETIPDHANSIVEGAYPKAVGTAVSGYLAKELIAAMQTEVLADKGTDCGTLRTIDVTIPQKGGKDYAYRYIKEGNKEVLLTPDIMPKYIGKTVHMRSPLACAGIGKDHHLCNKCAGDYYYMVNKKNIGLVATNAATACTRLNINFFVFVYRNIYIITSLIAGKFQ